MAGGQNWANRAGAARQGREGKTGSGGHHRFQQEQTPGAKAAPVPSGRQALGPAAVPSPTLPRQRPCPQRSYHWCPGVRSKEKAGHSSPPESILLCLRPRQLRLLGICPRRPYTQGTCHARPQQPADCVSVPLTSDPASKRQRRSCPNSPQGPASQRAEYKLAKKSSNLEYYKCSLYFRNCGSGHWVPWCSQKFLLQIHPGTVPVSPDPVGLTRASLGDTNPGRGAEAWAPGMGLCPSKPPQPSQGSHAGPRPAHQPPAGPLQSLGVHEMRQADAILLV